MRLLGGAGDWDGDWVVEERVWVEGGVGKRFSSEVRSSRGEGEGC